MLFLMTVFINGAHALLRWSNLVQHLYSILDIFALGANK